VSYFARCNATKIYSFWHITLARFLQHNPLPPSMRVVHIAAQATTPCLTFTLPSPLIPSPLFPIVLALEAPQVLL